MRRYAVLGGANNPSSGAGLYEQAHVAGVSDRPLSLQGDYAVLGSINVSDDSHYGVVKPLAASKSNTKIVNVKMASDDLYE